MADMTRPCVRVRGRGPLMVMCRWGGLVATGVPLFGYVIGDLGMVPAAIALSIGAVWQIWLSRTGVTVSGSEVRLRGLASSRTVPLSAVLSFGVARHQRPLDRFEREVSLVIHLEGGAELTWRWVGWRDLLSPWFAAGERPLPTASQEKVLRRLNAVVRQPNRSKR